MFVTVTVSRLLCSDEEALRPFTDAGAPALVYRTDAGISKKVKIAFAIPAKDGPAIRYPITLLKDAPQPEAARKFLQHLASPDAARVFEKSGFIILP